MYIENNLVIVGKGLFHAVEVTKLPEVGDELNLGSKQLPDGGGKYKVTKVATIQWGGAEYPHVLIERVGDIPEGQKTCRALCSTAEYTAQSSCIKSLSSGNVNGDFFV